MAIREGQPRLQAKKAKAISPPLRMLRILELLRRRLRFSINEGGA
jgi:hypothetical protein